MSVLVSQPRPPCTWQHPEFKAKPQHLVSFAVGRLNSAKALGAHCSALLRQETSLLFKEGPTLSSPCTSGHLFSLFCTTAIGKIRESCA